MAQTPAESNALESVPHLTTQAERRITSLSIVVPVLNEAHGLVDVLNALAPLRARGVEVIVVDGGSTDGTVALAAPLADAVLTSLRGRARQMRLGADRARGQCLLFLHADTQLPQDADAALAKAVAKAVASSPAAHVWGRFDVHITGRSRWLPVIALFMNCRSRWTGIATGDQAMFMTRAAYDAVGGFAHLPLMEDVEMSKRLCRLSRPICLRERVTTSGRRWEQHGVWRTILLMWRLRFLYWIGVSAERLAPQYR